MMDEGVRVVRKGRATETDSFASYKVSWYQIGIFGHMSFRILNVLKHLKNQTD